MAAPELMAITRNSPTLLNLSPPRNDPFVSPSPPREAGAISDQPGFGYIISVEGGPVGSELSGRTRRDIRHRRGFHNAAREGERNRGLQLTRLVKWGTEPNVGQQEQERSASLSALCFRAIVHQRIIQMK